MIPLAMTERPLRLAQVAPSVSPGEERKEETPAGLDYKAFLFVALGVGMGFILYAIFQTMGHLNDR